MRRIRSVLVGVLAAALLAGCVAIPTSGGVTPFNLRGADDVPNFNFVARPPTKDADQDEILAGFIQAGIDTQDRYAVARQFLTTEMAARWNPTASVIVTDGSRTSTSRIDTSTMSLTVQGSARIDSSGQYTPDTSSTSMTFGFTKQKGQWRISDAPGGTVLSPYNFTAIFAARPLYFVDPTGAFLVPDQRWYPAGSSAADRVVRGLLAGPASWLGSGAVVSAFPRGTQLGSDGVQISDGVATVDLSSQVLDESSAGKQRMLAQLLSSLSSITTLSAVRLTVRGVAVDVPAVTDGTTPTDDPMVGSSTIAFGATDLGTVTGGSLRALDVFTAKTASVGPGPGTLDRARSTLVVRSNEGVWRIPDSGTATITDRRSGLVAPSIDPEGFVWSAQGTGLGTLVAYDPKTQASHAIASASPSTSGTLVALRISRDGTRIAFGVSTPDGPEILVGAILRDSSFVPTGLGPLLSIPATGGDLVDLTWMDPLTVAYIARDSNGTSVRSQPIGGRDVSLGRTADATQIVGGNGGADGLRVLTSTGDLLQQTGAGGWQTTGSERLTYLVTQQ